MLLLMQTAKSSGEMESKISGDARVKEIPSNNTIYLKIIGKVDIEMSTWSLIEHHNVEPFEFLVSIQRILFGTSDEDDRNQFPRQSGLRNLNGGGFLSSQGPSIRQHSSKLLWNIFVATTTTTETS